MRQLVSLMLAVGSQDEARIGRTSKRLDIRSQDQNRETPKVVAVFAEIEGMRVNCQSDITQFNHKHDQDDASWTHQTKLIEKYLALEEQP